MDTIYPPGADTHSYEPTQRDMINIAKSDLFIYSSDDLDPVAKTITQSMTNDDMKLAVAADLNHHTLLEEDHDHEDATSIIVMKRKVTTHMFGSTQS